MSIINNYVYYQQYVYFQHHLWFKKKDEAANRLGGRHQGQPMGLNGFRGGHQPPAPGQREKSKKINKFEIWNNTDTDERMYFLSKSKTWKYSTKP